MRLALTRKIMGGSFLVCLMATVHGCSSATRAASLEEEAPPADGRPIGDYFAGRFPGVEVSRVPTGGITIRIRGASTFFGSSEPLYIIDGARVQSGPGGLVFLDPGDIAKIEVLKDIGSTSLYGSEGANGVIIITTKRAQ